MPPSGSQIALPVSRAKARAFTRASPNSLASPGSLPSSDEGRGRKEKNLPAPRGAAVGTPSPAAPAPPPSCASQPGRAAGVGLDAARSQGTFTRPGPGAAPTGAGARPTGLARSGPSPEPAGGPPLFSSPGSPCAPRPERRIRPLAARICGQQGRELRRRAPGADHPVPRPWVPSPKAAGRTFLQGPSAERRHGSAAACPNTRKLPAPRVGKAAASPALEEPAAPATGTRLGTRVGRPGAEGGQSRPRSQGVFFSRVPGSPRAGTPSRLTLRPAAPGPPRQCPGARPARA